MKFDVLTAFTMKANERWILDFLLLSSLCYARLSVDVVEKTSEGWNLVHSCDASGADFGREIPMSRYQETGCVSFTEPKDACEKVERPSLNMSYCKNVYAVVPRGVCRFSEKAYNVQLGHYRAVIVFSRLGEGPSWMEGTTYAERVRIPVVMVDYECMEKIMEIYSPENGIRITIHATFDFVTFARYIPFILVIAPCFVILLLSALKRRLEMVAQKRLTKRKIKKLPTKKYKIGFDAETCVICLNEFVEGEVLRLLPCKHVYHRHCIDLWLKKNQEGTCPTCRREVYTPEASGDSKSDIEQQDAGASRNLDSSDTGNVSSTRNKFISRMWGKLFHLKSRNELRVVDDVEDGQGTSHNVSPEAIAVELNNNRTDRCSAGTS